MRIFNCIRTGMMDSVLPNPFDWTVTIRKGMLDTSFFNDVPYQLVYGMISALLAAAIWLHIASYLGWPVST